MAFPLSLDIIHYILTLLPDFATLLSAVLTSKSFYEVYLTYPDSILFPVAANQIGPEVLSCAIRLAHFNRDDYLASRTTYVQGFHSEKEFSHIKVPKITSHVRALARNDKVARELELFISTKCVLLFNHLSGCTDRCLGNRWKDRESGFQSKLNSRESLRFRRAFYRWLLWSKLFPLYYLRSARLTGKVHEGETKDNDNFNDNTDNNTGGNTDNKSNNDGGGAPDVHLPNSYNLQKMFLSKFSDDEVLEVWHTSSFMTFVIGYTLKAASGPGVPESELHICIHFVLYLMAT